MLQEAHDDGSEDSLVFVSFSRPVRLYGASKGTKRCGVEMTLFAHLPHILDKGPLFSDVWARVQFEAAVIYLELQVTSLAMGSVS